MSEPADHFCGNFPTVGAQLVHTVGAYSWCTVGAPATKHNGRVAVKFGTYWSRLGFMVRKNTLLKLTKYQCYDFGGEVSDWIIGVWVEFLYTSRHWWSTVPWSLCVLGMLIVVILVLVGFNGNHCNAMHCIVASHKRGLSERQGTNEV